MLQMLPEIVRDVVKGKGHIVLTIPFKKIVERNGDVKIDSVEELEAVVMSVYEKIPGEKWGDLFEFAILNKYGYPVTYEFADSIGKSPSRYMHLLKRPVQPGSTKTLVDNSPESKLFVFGETLVLENFGPDFKLDKLSFLLSEGLAKYQIRHIDYNAHGVREVDEESDFALVIPIKHRGSMCGYDFSQHIVQAEAEAIHAGVAENRRYSFVRDKLSKNPNFKIGITECGMTVIFFGQDEMLIFGDNYVHGGDANYMDVELIRLHFYITRVGSSSLNNKTVVLENVTWDLTRKGSCGPEKMYKNVETLADYNKLKAKFLAGMLINIYLQL